MLYSITLEIPGKLNEDWIPTCNICLSKGICEVNTLALQTYNTLKINTNLTVAHYTTGEYEFRGLGDNRFWIF